MRCYSLVLASLAVLLPLAAGQILVPGNCPLPKVLDTFNITEFTKNVWYEHSKYDAQLEDGYECIVWKYSKRTQQVGAMLAHVNMRSSWGYTWMEDTLAPRTAVDTADYDYVCIHMPVTHLPLPGTYRYQILATDYKSYTVAWSCRNTSNGHEEILWILTEQRSPPAKAKADALAAAKAAGLIVYESYLRDVNQSGC